MKRAFLCLLPMLAGAGVAQAQDRTAWRISETTGDVRIVEAGRTRAATRGALLSGGSVMAGARGRAVLVRGRQYVLVSPNSTLRVGGPTGGNNSGSMVQMILDAGNAVFKVDRRETPHFRVQTRYLAAVVRGTTFSVTVSDTAGSVQVTEGAVQVSTPDGGASELVRPGMIASVGKSDLYRLTISGEGARVIRSPGAPGASVTTPAPRANAGGGSDKPGGKPDSPRRANRIDAPVGEEPVRLADSTNGLLQGEPSIQAALRGHSDFVRSERAREDRGKPDGDNGKPENGKPDNGKPDNGKPDEGKPDNGKPDGKPDNGKPDDGNPDEGKPDNGKPDDGKPDDGKPDHGKPDEGKPDDGKPDDGAPDDGKSDDGKPDDGKPDDGKPHDGKDDDGGPDDGKPDDGKSDDGDEGDEPEGGDNKDGEDDRPDEGKPDKPDQGGSGGDKPDKPKQ